MINRTTHGGAAAGTVELRKFDGAVVRVPKPGWLGGRQVGRACIVGRIIYRIIRIERSRGSACGKIVIDVGFIVGHEIGPAKVPCAAGLVPFVITLWAAR